MGFSKRHETALYRSWVLLKLTWAAKKAETAEKIPFFLCVSAVSSLLVAARRAALWGKDAKLISPHVSDQCLNDALLLELNYLKQDLASNAGNRSEKAFIHNAYAVLTACRILYSAHYRALASNTQACAWAMETVPPTWRAIIQAAKESRLKNAGSTTPQSEQDAVRFVEFVTDEVNRILP